MRRLYAASLIIVAFCFESCHVIESRAFAAPAQITVAAAANLMEVAQALGSQFEVLAHVHPVFSFGSTAQLTQQIENSAPFDVFMAADAEHIEKLEREHLITPIRNSIYAIGILALWVPPSAHVPISAIQDLAAADVRVIAVANPKLAPYGSATVDALQHAGIWDQVKSKIVYAENISMAKQYGVSNNADAVFTAYSLVLKQPGKVIRIDESMHQAIIQKLGIVARSDHPAAARSFLDFVLGAQGRAILSRHGYNVQ
jgi:molybdate transport system substrate-binding protein